MSNKFDDADIEYPNAPKYQPCLICGKGCRRTKKSGTVAYYPCIKCKIDNIISIARG